MIDNVLKHRKLDTENNQESSLNDNSISKTNWFKWFLGATVFVVVSIIVFLLVMKGLPWTMEKRGHLGDMFGVIGALFSGLAFAGVVVSMLQQNEDLNLQRKELALQRQEIAQTNKELKLQRAEMQEQNKTIMLQRFENTFFSMLEMQQKIVADLKYESEETGEYKGRDVFDRMYKNFYDYAFVDKRGHRYKHLTKDSPIDAFMECYGFAISSGQIRYFDHLYRILKYIDFAECLEYQERYNYVCILRAQLSKPELLMLFYFCLYEKSHRLKKLMEKYAFFKHIRSNRFVIVARKDNVLSENHYKLYAPSAYEENAAEYPAGF